MKKVLAMVAFVMVSVIIYAFNAKAETNQGKKEVTGNGEVVVMNKEMFLKDVFDYEKSKEWKYKGPPLLTSMPTGADHVGRQLLS
jgi:thioredoxin 1